MKILITGSNGLLGQKLIYTLLSQKDIEIIATSQGDNRLLKKEGYIYESLDIRNEANVDSIISKYKPDALINTAAMTNVDACEIEKEKCWKLNVEAVKYLVKACEKDKVHLIHISTDFIFDGKHGPYRENDLPNPLSYYALSKYESEKIVQASTNWAILRTIILYGVTDNMSRSNIVLWAKDALEKGKKIDVVDDQFRAPTLAEDLADACISAARKKAQGVYHVSGKDIMSILDLVYNVADFFKLDKTLVNPIKSHALNQAAKRPPYTGFILEKAKRELDYKPHSFIEGLQILAKQLNKNYA